MKKLVKKISSIFTLSMLFSFQLVSTAHAGLTWSAYGTDLPTTSYIYYVGDFVVDSSGRIHMAALRLNNSNFSKLGVSYGYTDNGTSYTWDDTIQSTAGDVEAAWQMKIKLDPSGDPGIVYQTTDSSTNVYTSYYVHSDDWTSSVQIDAIDEDDISDSLHGGYIDFDFLANGEPSALACTIEGTHTKLSPYVFNYSATGPSFTQESSPIEDYSETESCVYPKYIVETDLIRHASWTQDTGSGNAILYSKTTDGGTVWNGDGAPSIALSANSDRIAGGEMVLDSSDSPIILSALNLGTQFSPNNTVHMAYVDGGWTTDIVASGLTDAYLIRDEDLRDTLISVDGYEYIAWQNKGGSNEVTQVANNESNSWIVDDVVTIGITSVLSDTVLMEYDSNADKIVIHNIVAEAGNTEQQFYTATPGDDVGGGGGGGAVPEFKDYMLVLTVLLAVGMITQQRKSGLFQA